MLEYDDSRNNIISVCVDSVLLKQIEADLVIGDKNLSDVVVSILKSHYGVKEKYGI